MPRDVSMTEAGKASSSSSSLTQHVYTIIGSIYQIQFFRHYEQRLTLLPSLYGQRYGYVYSLVLE